MRWCFWFNLGRLVGCYVHLYTKKKAVLGCYLHIYYIIYKEKVDLLDVIYTYIYKEKSWTCWMLYLHVQRKKLDLLDMLSTYIYIYETKAGLIGCYLHVYTKKKAGLVGCYLYYKEKAGLVQVM